MLDEYDGALYERLEPPVLDVAWLRFYTLRDECERTRAQWGPPYEAMLRARNRLVLHYAPIVKYVVHRRCSEYQEVGDSRTFAVALLSVIRGMMRSLSGALDDWTPACVTLTVAACDAVNRPTDRSTE